jgi:HTH-type transcriptional regulator/antitoxin HigA
MMEQSGRTQADLAELLGSRPRASEILNEKRELTLEQIRLISARWDIPAGALVGELAPA